MLFNSAEYLLFLPFVLAVYLLLRRVGLGAQNLWLLIVSYVFYGWWDWRFLGLLFGTTLNDYLVGLALAKVENPRYRRALLALSIGVNLGVLGFFKYFNFFVESLVEAFAGIGITLHAPTLRVILPVGISFYTFQALTYTIAIYRRQMQPVRDPVTFFAYVAFFPQLVAGPIERAQHLLPQFMSQRRTTADDFAAGLRQILWGFFCKLVVADNCAVVVNAIFDEKGVLPGSVVLIGSICFAFQIYADFSGYSHIAIGSARLLGFDLMQNFATPYFSRSIPEFWHRWHISLSSWFRDYVYIPLGGNRGGRLRQARNLLATFTLSGLWHGANWTFVAWGFLNGLYMLPKVFIGEPLERLAAARAGLARLGITGLRILLTFALTLVAWIFFRAADIHSAAKLFGELGSSSLFTTPLATLRGLEVLSTAVFAAFAITVLLGIEWVQRDKKHALEFDDAPAVMKWAAYAGVITLIIVLRYTGAALDFIYFQF